MNNSTIERASLPNALNNEMRMKIFKKLSEKDMHISKLSKELNISGSTVSKHVRVLENADLIKRKVHGKSHVLSIKDMNILRNEDGF
ncbi:winged helix-turn-helix domain-containing protein [uncultured Methanolobus sp.]|uniref:ArsR/SmtB family transcription factor n=1 Tax=uncultured Methanolobus sp. TaxID=218300 RepID=UPI0029C8EF84|nr:winged helix-turn-helix domain-containing protein [uncultured Methanolobus sp.]